MKQQAFFYDGDYYLYPEDCASPEALVKAHGGGKGFIVQQLVEKKCIPPCFVSEHVKSRRIRLPEGAAVYPCEAELLSAREYDERLLKLVEKHCPGCRRYVNSADGSLKGHHEELSLDGVCFDRYEGSRELCHASFKNGLESFVRLFSRQGFEEMIDDGQTELAEEAFWDLFEEELATPRFPVYFLKDAEGKYALYFSMFACSEDTGIIQQLCRMLKEKYEKTWSFHSFLPKGYFAPQALKPRGIVFKAPGEEPYEFSVYTDPERPYDTWLWLCGQFGENRLRCSLLADMRPASEKPKNCPTLKKALSQIDAYLEEQDEQMRQMLGRVDVLENVLPAFSIFTREDLPPDADEETVMKNSMSVLSYDSLLTNAFALAVEDKQTPVDLWEMESILSETQRPIACIQFKLVSDRPAAAPVLMERLRKQNLLALGCVVTKPGEKLGKIWGVVLDYARLKSELRRWTPAFCEDTVEIDVYTPSRSEGGRFRLDWNMTRLVSEAELGVTYAPPQEP